MNQSQHDINTFALIDRYASIFSLTSLPSCSTRRSWQAAAVLIWRRTEAAAVESWLAACSGRIWMNIFGRHSLSNELNFVFKQMATSFTVVIFWCKTKDVTTVAMFALAIKHKNKIEKNIYDIRAAIIKYYWYYKLTRRFPIWQLFNVSITRRFQHRAINWRCTHLANTLTRRFQCMTFQRHTCKMCDNIYTSASTNMPM